MAVTSVTQPGIIFGLNDSGHPPRLFAFDSSGTGRGIWELVGARNRDWEASSPGPCAASDSARSCLYVGDVGDNDAQRSYVTIYRIAEPTVGVWGGGTIQVAVLDQLHLRYADHPHDVEAMYVTRDGALFLITKRRLLDDQRRPRPALVFRVPSSAWDASGIVSATLVDSLPIVPGSEEGRQVNDASLSPDGRLLAVRTYAEIFVFRVDSSSGRPVAGQSPAPCRIRALDEAQGEGIAWWWDGRRLLLTSERRNAPFHVVACPLPPDSRQTGQS